MQGNVTTTTTTTTTTQPATSSQTTVKESPLRQSCDPCRRRKLKCSGQHTGCSTCQKNGHVCTYSPRSTLGRPRTGSEQQRQSKQNARKSSDLSSSRPRKKARQTPLTAKGNVLPQYSPQHYHQQQQVPSEFNQLLGAVEFAASRDSGLGHGQYAQYSYQHDAFIDPMLESFNVSRSPVANMQAHSNQMQQHHSPSNNDTNYVLTQHNTPHMPAPLPVSSQQPLLPCSCLADHYLVTSRLQTAESATPDIDLTTSLSSRLHIHRDALRVAHCILLCPHCSRSFMAGAHNVMMVIGLLTSIALSYRKLIEDIKTEAQRANTANEPKRFIISEGIGEPARPGGQAGNGIDVALTPMEWQTLILSTIRKDIYPWSMIRVSNDIRHSNDSTADNHSHQSPDTRNNLTLSELIVAMEERQRHNHRECPNPYKNNQDPRHHHEDDYNCLRMVKHVKSVMDSLGV